MDEWKRICCATDFSEPSRLALEEAARLAGRFQAELTVLHVFEERAVSPEILLSKYEQALPELEEKMASCQREAERISGRPVRTVILTGNSAALEIGRFAHDGSFDLLVVGTHGRTGLPRVVLGSVAERAVREAECSVLVARSSRRAEAG